MIIPDVNLLLYAHFADSPQHAAAEAWMAATFSGSEPVGVPWTVILGFLRIGTSPHIMRQPLAGATAAGVVQEWFGAHAVAALNVGPRHWEVLGILLEQGQCRGPLVADAHLAALAIENGALLCTTDRDFARFPGLRWKNPLLDL